MKTKMVQIGTVVEFHERDTEGTVAFRRQMSGGEKKEIGYKQAGGGA